jgi:membrane protein implicated in regulation of membrane protease activity
VRYQVRGRADILGVVRRRTLIHGKAKITNSWGIITNYNDTTSLPALSSPTEGFFRKLVVKIKNNLKPCYNMCRMPGENITTARLVLAIISTVLEEVAIYVIWRWLLPELNISVPVPVLIGVMIFWAIFAVGLFIFTTRTLKRQTVVGLPTMVGSRGKAASRMRPDGLVSIKGELWSAITEEEEVAKGEAVEVVGEEGLKLVVRKTASRKSTR